MAEDSVERMEPQARHAWLRLLAWRLGFGFAILLVWELAAGRLVDPFWFSRDRKSTRLNSSH